MSNINEADVTPPTPGSAVVCVRCGLVSVIADNGKRLRDPTAAERVSMLSDRHLQLVIRAQREVARKKSN